MRPRRDGRELKLPGERRRTAHEIWARRSGHFSMPATALHRSESYLSRPVAPFNAAGRTLFGPTRVPHDGSRIPPARSCPPLCLKVLCEPVYSCFSLKLLNGFLHKTRLVELIIGHNLRFRSPERVSTVDYGRQHSRGSPECGLGLRTSRTQVRVVARRP